jgi:hypothetical protein
MQFQSPTNLRRLHQVSAVVLLAVAAFLGWQASKLQFYTPVGPGAGFFPVWLAIALAALSAVMLLQTFTGEPEPLPEDFSPGRKGAVRVAVIMIGVIFFVAALTPLGFRLTTFILSIGLIHALGRTNPLISIPVSLGLSFGIYYVFSDLLTISLPDGPFGF